MKLKLFSGHALPKLTAPICLGLAIIATLVLIVQSVVPAGPIQSVTHFDKMVHFAAYFVVTALWIPAMGLRRLLTIALSVVCLGTGLEIAQTFMDLGRTGSFWDAFANTAGVALAAVLLPALVKRQDAPPLYAGSI